MGIPWEVALALRADGWYLRRDIIWDKLNVMPESVKDRPTTSHEYIFLFSKGQWKSRIVKFSDLQGQRFHFGQNIGLDGLSVGLPARLPIDIAAAIFNRAQRDKQFSLPPFYSEVWHQSDDGTDSDFVASLPMKHRAAVCAAKFLNAHTTAEQFLGEIDRLRLALPDGNKLLECWTSSQISDSPSTTSNGKGAITVHYPGQICEVDFCRHLISIRSPHSGSYYYDADAIAETVKASSKARVAQNGGNPIWNYDAGRDSVHSPQTADIKKMVRADDLRNARSVWTMPTRPYRGAHFATFPVELPGRCILAGSRKGDVVLDPFMGSGTTAQAAEALNRAWVGIDLNPDYRVLQQQRTAQPSLSL